MPYRTHGLRHDTDHLFAKLLAEDKWWMTPCVVIMAWYGARVLGGELREHADATCIRSAAMLLTFADDAQVVCGWPGKQRQDVFEFTVGQFRAFVQARSHSPQEASMTAVDEKEPCPEPKAASITLTAATSSICA
jgi:hypothetical protein